MKGDWMASRPARAVLGLLAVAVAACGGERQGSQEEVQRAPEAAAPANPLLDPSSPEMNQTAPEVYRVRFETSKGEFVVEVTRAWAPKGADRFYNLVRNGFYDGVRFFRVVPGFVVQFGINGDPRISARWRAARIEDDPVVQSNRRGTITFATAGPNSRTTQVFINYADNTNLDGQGFAPFGRVVQGMEVVDRINAEYGQSPNQAMIQQQGNAYLEAQFPRLDYIVRASVVQQ
jgi:peptidyl-prolyl cis-trans isomerase A (cyclophilin A)